MKQMNSICECLGLCCSWYRNPHGLSINPNISTVYDQMIVAFTIMKDQ